MLLSRCREMSEARLGNTLGNAMKAKPSTGNSAIHGAGRQHTLSPGDTLAVTPHHVRVPGQPELNQKQGTTHHSVVLRGTEQRGEPSVLANIQHCTKLNQFADAVLVARPGGTIQAGAGGRCHTQRQAQPETRSNNLTATFHEARQSVS